MKKFAQSILFFLISSAIVFGGEVTHFAVIGDFGDAGPAEKAVAALVKSKQPEFILTLGDNNYPNGEASTIDANIGQYFHEYIFPYEGHYGVGATSNRFFPSLGNHDWNTKNAQPYRNYFTLPGNERYYDFTRGPVHFFSLDADPNEPDGRSPNSFQVQWLKEALTASTSPWNIVYMHQPPYSSGKHGSEMEMRWPYQSWGAHAILAGHDHTYERLTEEDLLYIVCGVSGTPNRYPFPNIVSGSQIRFNNVDGALFIEATDKTLTFRFISTTETVLDSITLKK